MTHSGILLLDKPVGARSTACVSSVKHILQKSQKMQDTPEKIKVGHAGTLDSTASGLLIILLGSCTKMAESFMDKKKTYVAEVQLGAQTDSDDYSGKIILEKPYEHVTYEQINTAAMGFLGLRMQTPPCISAVHVNGKRAHELARRTGARPAIRPKPVLIETIKITSPLDENGKFKLFIKCSRGTYIRSLARDIGLALGSCAHIASLRREMCGDFHVQNALKWSEDMTGMEGNILRLSGQLPAPVLRR